MTFSIIVATAGRETLTRTLQSVTSQWQAGDELIVVLSESPWGHGARNDAVERAKGTHLIFMDDDDMYAPDALPLMRDKISTDPARVHLFKMRLPGGRTLWNDAAVRVGNVGTPMFAVPRKRGKVGRFGDRYEGDFDFLASTLELRGDQPLFHEDVVALINP